MLYVNLDNSKDLHYLHKLDKNLKCVLKIYKTYVNIFHFVFIYWYIWYWRNNIFNAALENTSKFKEKSEKLL